MELYVQAIKENYPESTITLENATHELATHNLFSEQDYSKLFADENELRDKIESHRNKLS